MTTDLTNLQDVKSYLRLIDTVEGRDALLSRLISAASGFARSYIGYDPMAGAEPGAQPPADLAQAVIEVVALLFAQQPRLGLMSRNEAGATLQYQTLSWPISVTSVLQSYQRVFF